MPRDYTLQQLRDWCAVPVEQLAGHPGLKVRLRIVADSAEMGELMARELIGEVAAHNAAGQATRAIVPCGPMAWYEPFCRLANQERVSLANLHVYHMDECLDWQGSLLPEGHRSTSAPRCSGSSMTRSRSRWPCPWSKGTS